MKENPFRKIYVPQDGNQKLLIAGVKAAAEELYDLFREAQKYDARCSNIAMTHLEESVMWSTKGITSVHKK